MIFIFVAGNSNTEVAPSVSNLPLIIIEKSLFVPLKVQIVP